LQTDRQPVKGRSVRIGAAGGAPPYGGGVVAGTGTVVDVVEVVEVVELVELVVVAATS
jgi:hypothetical protein